MLLTSLDAPGVTPNSRPLAWPDARAMFENAFDLDLERRIKYLWRLALTWNVRGRLLREFGGHAMAEALFRAQPRAFYPVMNHLIDRRMSAQARLRTTLASLRVVCDSVGDDANVRSLLTQGITLLELTDRTRVVLSLNDVSFHEGLWQVGLVGADGVRLYSIGFGFTDAQTLLMGNVQGPSLKDEGLDRIRDVTHAAHGMRPPHLLVHTLRVLAAQWGATRLQASIPRTTSRAAGTCAIRACASTTARSGPNTKPCATTAATGRCRWTPRCVRSRKCPPSAARCTAAATRCSRRCSWPSTTLADAHVAQRRRCPSASRSWAGRGERVDAGIGTGRLSLRRPSPGLPSGDVRGQSIPWPSSAGPR